MFKTSTHGPPRPSHLPHTHPSHLSLSFSSRPLPRNLLCFPKGNKVDQLSVYLNAADANDGLPDGWARACSFSLTLIHPADEARCLTKDAQHVFVGGAVDWGFTQFAPLEILTAPAPEGFVDARGGLTMRVALKVDDAAGIPADSAPYDSRRATGCVGLKNQGATCYMNSLLQTLYHLNYFRKVNKMQGRGE